MIQGLKTVIYPVTAWAASGCRCVPPRTATTTVGGYLRVTGYGMVSSGGDTSSGRHDQGFGLHGQVGWPA